MKIAVIGGGPAGCMASIVASEFADVTLFEKNEKIGKKLYITGKGRCNVTNISDPETLCKNVISNPKFVKSAFYKFSSSDLARFFHENGLTLKIERGNRAFPNTDKSSDVIKTLSNKLEQCKVKVKLNSPIESIGRKGNQFVVGGKKFDKIIITTGGLSYSATGSTGDGLYFAKQFGHNIVEPVPALCGIKLYSSNLDAFAGLSLKNVELKILENDKYIVKEFGELLFTHNGISGPCALTASSKINRKLEEGANLKAIIDLKPALDEATLENRILREFDAAKNKDIKNIMPNLVPSTLINRILIHSGISPDEKINNITKAQRKDLVRNLKNMTFNIVGLEDLNTAIITAGGVNVSEINPQTMESKLVPGLFFAGEVLDLDALTGGFNLQIAFSTGYLAGLGAVQEKNI